MAFKDYDEVAEPLVLPINGIEYTIPPIGVADGVRLTEGLEPGSKVPLSDAEFLHLVLGDAYELMLANNAPAASVTRAAMTSLAEFQSTRATAEIIWETGGHPKELEDLVRSVLNRQTRRKTRQGAATTTKPRSSGTGTKTSQSN